jgi:hypothetical protein
MEEVAAAARRDRSFPDPIDVNAGDAGEDEEEENEREALQSVECKGRRGGVSNAAKKSLKQKEAKGTKIRGWERR